jgi:hypothetical protein
VNHWVQAASSGNNAEQAMKKAPRVLFDDIEADITNKTEFLRKQRALLKEIIRDYGFIGTKINVLEATRGLFNNQMAGQP